VAWHAERGSVRANRGRDILPFLHVANRLLDEGEEVVLKLHTKHSPHRRDGARWRANCCERCLAAPRAAEIFEAFRARPRTRAGGGRRDTCSR
jgi:lipopolysaccharide biosynthesis protein